MLVHSTELKNMRPRCSWEGISIEQTAHQVTDTGALTRCVQRVGRFQPRVGRASCSQIKPENKTDSSMTWTNQTSESRALHCCSSLPTLQTILFSTMRMHCNDLSCRLTSCQYHIIHARFVGAVMTWAARQRVQRQVCHGVNHEDRPSSLTQKRPCRCQCDELCEFLLEIYHTLVAPLCKIVL